MSVKLSRFVNPETAMSQELLDALSVFSASCMAHEKTEVTAEEAVAFLTKWNGEKVAAEFKPECLFPALPPAP